MNEYVQKVKNKLEAQRNPEIAIPMANYMRNKFEFLGLKRPVLNLAKRESLKKTNLPNIGELDEIIYELWDLPEREFQYFALDLIEKFYRKLSSKTIKLYEYLLINKSWWDTVDMIAAKFVGDLFYRFPKTRDEYLLKWDKSNNIWLKRTCILFQLKYKSKTDTTILEMIIDKNLRSNEFFINKAIGWILREYSKTDANFVIDFVKRKELNNLSKREALKWLERKKQV